jgi:hypothetical protein
MAESVFVDNTAPSTKRAVVFWNLAIVLVAMLLADVFILVLVDWVGRLPDLGAWNQALWIRRMLVGAAHGSLIGTFTAQLLLAVVYAALGDGHSPRRILYTTLVLAVFVNALVVFGMSWFQLAWDETVILFLIATLVFFVFQIPMWGIRSCLGWTIKSPWSAAVPRGRLRFSLAHLLGWSTFLAVPLCIFSALHVPNARGPISYFFWFWGLILCVQLLWLAYMALAADMSKLKFTAVAVLSLLGAAAMQYAILWLSEGRFDSSEALAIGFANVCGGAVLLICFCLARRLGFRLLPFEAKRLPPPHSVSIRACPGGTTTGS